MVLTSIAEGTTTTGVVATFSDADPTDTAGNFTAVVNWGDGTTEVGAVAGSNGSFAVSVPGSTHFYADEGTAQPVVTITRTTDNDQIALIGTVTVAEGDVLTPHGTTITVLPEQAFNGTVATFTDSNINNAASDFVATIDWGDGTTTVGTVTDVAGGIGVSGTRSYATPGTDNVLTRLTENTPGTAAATAVSTANVVNPIIVPPLPPVPQIHANDPRYISVHANDLGYSSTASGPNHFIDLLNFGASYPDLVASFGTNQDALQSWYNAREPIENRVETFDGLDYVASFRDLISAFGTAGSMKAVQDDGASHYITNGEREGRATTFNGLDYIASYSDLIRAFGANNDAGAYHYIESGHNEGRTTSFDGLDYIASYADLIKAFGANEQAGAAHFITYGYNEGRATTFNGLDYIASYGDLIQAFGANDDAGATHFIENGHNEGRTTTSTAWITLPPTPI
jgi:hypothetical protein